MATTQQLATAIAAVSDADAELDSAWDARYAKDAAVDALIPDEIAALATAQAAHNTARAAARLTVDWATAEQALSDAYTQRLAAGDILIELCPPFTNEIRQS